MRAHLRFPLDPTLFVGARAPDGHGLAPHMSGGRLYLAGCVEGVKMLPSVAVEESSSTAGHPWPHSLLALDGLDCTRHVAGNG